jgi:hypothetical protein
VVRRAKGEADDGDVYALTALQPFVLRVDLGGTKIRVAFADLTGWWLKASR